MTTRKRAAIEVPEASGGGESRALDALTGGDQAVVGPRVDPRALVIDANVRREVDLTAAFVGSVREHGVLSPVLVRRDTLGQLLVVDGQRRTLAAIEADVATVPYAWVSGVGDDETRIVDQVVLNEHRTPLSAADVVEATQQLALMGRSAASIAKGRSVPVEQVEAELCVAASESARDLLAQEPDMPLDLVADLTDLVADVRAVGDDAAATAIEESLRGAFRDYGAAEARVELEQERQEVARRRMERAAIEEYAQEGATAWFGWTPPAGAVRIGDLTAQPGKGNTPGAPLTQEEHASCPSRGVRLSLDREAGAWIEVAWYCLGWKGAGHYKWAAANSSGATSGPKSEEELARAREKAERHRRLAAVTTVRREWVRGLLQRKTIPADAIVLVAKILTYWGASGCEDLAREWGILPQEEYASEAAERLTDPKKAARFLLGVAIARAESAIGDHWYEGPRSAPRPFRDLLAALGSWGYELSESEKAVLAPTSEGDAVDGADS